MHKGIERVLGALDDIRAGKMVVVVDDEHRENEGDLTMAAELVTPEAINFMAQHGRGLICLSMTEERIRRLELPMMVEENRATRSTAFTVSIEARVGVTTGISAADRAHTIRTAVARDAVPRDIVSPGHVFPLKAQRGGVLRRTGHTEGAVDLARLAGLEPAGVICEIMKDDGTMARYPDLVEFGERHGLRIVSIADLIAYRLTRERLVRRLRRGRTEAQDIAEIPQVPLLLNSALTRLSRLDSKVSANAFCTFGPHSPMSLTMGTMRLNRWERNWIMSGEVSTHSVQAWTSMPRVSQTSSPRNRSRMR